MDYETALILLENQRQKLLELLKLLKDEPWQPKSQQDIDDMLAEDEKNMAIGH